MTTYVTDEVRGLIGTRGEKQTATDPLSAHELRRFLQAVMDPGDWSADGLDFPPLYEKVWDGNGQ